MPTRSRRPALALLVAALAVALPALLAGCDTNDPGSVLEEVEGSYRFTRLAFGPDAAGVDTADVVATLDQAQTRVRLFGTGQMLVEYKLVGEPSALVNGTFTATSSTVRLSATTQSDANRLAVLLLPQTLTLTRSTDDRVLTAAINTTVNLQAYDPDTYAGLTAVPGRLFVTLER